MERSEGAFAAFDGTELVLADGRVVRVPPFTVGEAATYLRLLSKVQDGNAEAHAAFLATFPVRAGIADVPISAFAFGVPVPGATDMTVARAMHLADTVGRATQPNGWSAQVEVLDMFPGLLGLATDAAPADVFAAAREFTQEVYALLYGLAESFFGHLASSPSGQVMTMRGAPEGLTSSTGSTT